MTDATQAPPTTLAVETPPANIPDGPDGNFDGFGATADTDFNDILEAFGGQPIGPTSTTPAAPAADPATSPAPAAPTTEPQPSPAAPSSVAPSPSATPSSPDPAAAPAVPPADPALAQPAAPAIPQDLLIASLQAQVQTLTQQLKDGGTTPAPAATPTTPAAGNEEPAAPAHSLTVPQEVVSALFGEDAGQAHNALNHMLSSMANYIHKTLRAEYGPLIEGKVNALRTELATRETTSTAEQTRLQQQEAYYAAFPGHKNAIMTPLIAQAAGEVFAELPHAVWNDQTIAVVGARVNHKLAQLGMQPPAITDPVGTQPAPTATSASPAPAPAAMLPTAPAAPVGGDAADEILSTFAV